MKVKHFWNIHELRAGVTPLLNAHYLEVGNTALFDLEPDWDTYANLMTNGQLIALGAFDGERCVGYSVSFIRPHVHYIHQTMAYNDVLFVQACYRDSMAGGKLMIETRRQAAYAGCTGVVWHAKPGTALNTLLEKRVPLHELVYIEAL